jgi:cyclo(L-tyrosyl-L-tyrosyl) synthase
MNGMDSTVTVIPVTDRCRQIATDSKHICFGISPFNSYYSETRIKALATWGIRTFSSMHFFVPDIPSAYTFEALGYTPEKSAWKARRQCQYLFNKISKSLISLGIDNEVASEMIVGWHWLNQNETYRRLYREAVELYQNDPEFRSACNEASLWVLERKIPNGVEINEAILQAGVKYLFSEIPLFVNSAGIFSQESSVFSYHQPVSFIQQLFERKISMFPSENQGFLIVDPALESAEMPNQPCAELAI